MAIFKYQHYLSESSHSAFDQIYAPGTATPYSGIYRCEGCGVNEVSTYSHPLPPQNHHQHGPEQGPVQWRLVVATR